MKRKRSRCSFRFPLLSLVFVLALLFISRTTLPTMEAQVEPETNGNRLEQLGALSGRPAGELTLVDRASLTLLVGWVLEWV